MKKEVIIRTIILAVALLNQVLMLAGIQTIPVDDAALAEWLSMAFTGAAAVWAWWKNNSFTKAAIEADEILADLKKGLE